MKRKWFYILLFCSSTTSLSAQVPGVAIIKFWNRYQAGIEAGPALTSVWGNNYYYHKPDIHYSAGAFFRYNFLQWIAIQTSINVERVGTKSDIVWTNTNGDIIGEGYAKTQYDYVTFPIIFRFDATNRKFNLNFSLGGFVSYMFNANSIISPLPPGTANDPNPGEESVTDISDGYKKHNAGLIAGIGLDYQFIFGLKIGCELRDQLGLVNISKITPNTPFRTNSLQLLGRVSYRF